MCVHMGSLARSRAAQPGVRTRIADWVRRGSKAPRTTAEVDAERAARGQETLSDRRGGLPARGQVRKMHTHVESVTGALMVATEDENVFGMLLVRPLGIGDAVEITRREGCLQPSAAAAAAQPSAASRLPTRSARL